MFKKKKKYVTFNINYDYDKIIKTSKLGNDCIDIYIEK